MAAAMAMPRPTPPSCTLHHLWPKPGWGWGDLVLGDALAPGTLGRRRLVLCRAVEPVLAHRLGQLLLGQRIGLVGRAVA